MKTEKEVEEFRKEIEQRLIDVSKLPDPDAAMRPRPGPRLLVSPRDPILR